MFRRRDRACSPLWKWHVAWFSKYVSNAPPRMLMIDSETWRPVSATSASGEAVHSQTLPTSWWMPPTLVQLNPSARYSVGVQLERNMCVIVVVDLVGRQMACR